MNNSTIFLNAWAISRIAAAQFGGSVKSYFAEALKMAYAQKEEKTERSTESKLTDMGFTVWEKGNQRRVYFSKAKLESIFDLDVDYGSQGRVSYATIQGEKISNATASEWLVDAGYYDCKRNKFVGSFATSKRLANALEAA